MARWYKPSFSLASKCRLGFAAAVLVIIAAALVLPYRWMDKLVEQGKIELAQSEAQHVLARHFRSLKDPDTGSEVPPLALEGGTTGSILTARWRYRESETSGDPGRGVYVITPSQTASGDNTAGSEALQARSFTEWIRLPAGLNRSATLPEPLEKGPRPAVDETSPGSAVPDDPGQTTEPFASSVQSLSRDPFVYQAIEKFLQPDGPREIFQLQQPVRYVRSVWGDRNCLTSGCHSPSESKLIEPGSTEEEKPPVFTEGQLIGLISVTLPSGQIGTTLLFNRFFIILGGFLASLCAIITFYLITQRVILEPVRTLRAAADKVTLSSDEQPQRASQQEDSWQQAIEITSTIRTGDEFERLAEAFHQMLSRMKFSQDKLRQANRALDSKLGELEAKNLALYESNKLKSEFLANVSHELRTPLNAIIGFAEILKEQIDPGKERKKTRYVNHVLESGKMLLGIINNLLNLARIESGKMEVRWEKCSIREIAEILVDFTRPLAQEKQLNVNLSIDEGIGLVETDPGKVQQILFNLLSNAIKFTPRRGRIDLKAHRIDERRFQLVVADTGEGIRPEDREKIFEKFQQLDGSVTRQHSGAGLGLAIVKDLVQLLRGRISVGSQNDKGAVFTVELPTRKEYAVMQPISYQEV
ncbi:MAG: hypothetical protein IID32_09310 [Planctomycetes bacterium]|nr:hypothetical protein [Planctomycetota bacterium]